MINRFMPDLHGNHAALRVVEGVQEFMLHCDSRQRES
jgi:hypothetical protein